MKFNFRLSREGTVNVFTMMPKDPELKIEYQNFKADSILRAFKLVSLAAFGLLIMFALYAILTKTKHA